MHIAEATWTDVAAAGADLALLPVGSTEQHGPHAPLGTDAIAAAAVADAAAAATDRSVAVAPPIPVGMSEEHRHFAGTLWVSPDTFRAYVRETAESLAAQGFERVVIVNGHGGNTAALREVAAGLTRAATGEEGGEGSRDGAESAGAERGGPSAPYTVAFTWFDAVDEPEMGHAGPVETSLLLEVRPELVDESRLAAAADGASERWGEYVRGMELAYDAADFSPNGTVGDPSAAAAKRGAALLAAARDALCEVIDAVAERELGERVGPAEERGEVW